MYRSELSTLQARSIPLVVFTSNATRELSEALTRRCLHVYLQYPSAEVELEIVRLKAPLLRETRGPGCRTASGGAAEPANVHLA